MSGNNSEESRKTWPMLTTSPSVREGLGKLTGSDHLPVRHDHALGNHHDSVADVKAIPVHVRFLAAVVDRYLIAHAAVLVQDGPLDVAVAAHVHVRQAFLPVPLALLVR